MAEMKKVPAIRFKGFSEVWEDKQIADLCSETTGGGTPKTTESKYWNGGIPWLQSSDLVENQLSNVVYRKTITEHGLKSSATKLVPADSIAIITRVGVGKLALISYEYSTSQDFLSLSYLKVDKWFGAYSIWKKIQSELHAVQGTSIKGITKEELLSKKTLIAKEKNEQTQIGGYFQHFDKLISLHQAKVDKLVNLKKAMLEKMFPKQGADMPEIRFKGFKGCWVQKKLGELMNVTSVKRIHQSDWTSAGVRFLRARDIVSAFKNEKIADYLYISKQKYDDYSLISGKVKKGDLLVTGVGTIGVPFLIIDDKPLYFKDGNIIWFQNEDKLDENFFFYSFVGAGIQNFIRDSAGTGTVGTFTIDSGKKTPVLIPKDETEQNRRE